jgi:segregation and condensation protein B
MERTELKALVEALVFASESPLTADKIKQIIENVHRKEILDVISELQNDYAQATHGLQLTEVANGFQFRTKPEYSYWLKKFKKTKPFRLTQPTLETLAIIAYKQPITRLEIEKIRGVDTGGVIKALLEKKLICIAGRKNVPGKPFLLGTTKTFLEIFSLENLSSLPSIKEIEDLDNAQLPTILSDHMTQNLSLTDGELSAESVIELSTEGQEPSDNILQDMEATVDETASDEANNAHGDDLNSKDSTEAES